MIHNNRGMGMSVALVLAMTACGQQDNTTPAPAPAPANPTLVVSAKDTPLTTIIANKEAAQHIVNGMLVLDFAVIGGTVSSSINDFRFQCKREGEDDFSICPSGSVYRFTNLKAGTSYQLTVQATSISTGTEAIADSLSFSLEPKP